MKEEVFITYGCGNSFDIQKFVPPKNEAGGYVKPRGGLWSSPVNSKHGWKDWCESEDFHKGEDGTSFRFTLKKEAKVYKINTVGDLLRIPYKLKSRCSVFGTWVIDYEAMAQEYDAIWLTAEGERETRYSDREYGMSLYGWDCETLLVLRPSIIEVEEV